MQYDRQARMLAVVILLEMDLYLLRDQLKQVKHSALWSTLRPLPMNSDSLRMSVNALASVPVVVLGPGTCCLPRPHASPRRS